MAENKKMLSNLNEYYSLYKYVRAMRAIQTKSGIYGKVLSKYPEFADEANEAGNRMEACHKLLIKYAADLGFDEVLTERKCRTLGRHAFDLKGSNSNLPSLEEIDDARAQYLNHRDNLIEQKQSDAQSLAVESKHLKKELNKKKGKVFGNVLFGALGGTLALGLTAGLGVGLWTCVSAALSATFGVGTGFAIGGIAIGIIGGKWIIGGLKKMFKKIKERVSDAWKERAAAKSAYTNKKQQQKAFDRELKSLNSARVLDDQYEAINEWLGENKQLSNAVREQVINVTATAEEMQSAEYIRLQELDRRRQREAEALDKKLNEHVSAIYSSDEKRKAVEELLNNVGEDELALANGVLENFGDIMEGLSEEDQKKFIAKLVDEKQKRDKASAQAASADAEATAEVAADIDAPEEITSMNIEFQNEDLKALYQGLSVENKQIFNQLVYNVYNQTNSQKENKEYNDDHAETYFVNNITNRGTDLSAAPFNLTEEQIRQIYKDLANNEEFNRVAEVAAQNANEAEEKAAEEKAEPTAEVELVTYAKLKKEQKEALDNQINDYLQSEVVSGEKENAKLTKKQFETKANEAYEAAKKEGVNITERAFKARLKKMLQENNPELFDKLYPAKAANKQSSAKKQTVELEDFARREDTEKYILEVASNDMSNINKLNSDEEKINYIADAVNRKIGQYRFDENTGKEVLVDNTKYVENYLKQHIHESMFGLKNQETPSNKKAEPEVEQTSEEKKPVNKYVDKFNRRAAKAGITLQSETPEKAEQGKASEEKNAKKHEEKSTAEKLAELRDSLAKAEAEASADEKDIKEVESVIQQAQENEDKELQQEAEAIKKELKKKEAEEPEMGAE